MNGIAQFKVYEEFEQLLLQAEAFFFPKKEKKSETKWGVGAQAIIPHIVWSYTNSNVDTSIGRKERGDYETSLLFM